jgi:Trk-type K+ transport system membrane component
MRRKIKRNIEIKLKANANILGIRLVKNQIIEIATIFFFFFCLFVCLFTIISSTKDKQEPEIKNI